VFFLWREKDHVSHPYKTTGRIIPWCDRKQNSQWQQPFSKINCCWSPLYLEHIHSLKNCNNFYWTPNVHPLTLVMWEQGN
jgi:hypothetical protein